MRMPRRRIMDIELASWLAIIGARMRLRSFALMAVAQICAFTSALHGQVQSAQFKKTVQGIADYDMPSITRAGNSGNRGYVPYLRDILTSTPAYRAPAEEEAVIALVKLGDKEKSRELECDLLSNEPGTWKHLANTMLPKIRGWFSIRAYYYMLTDNQEFEEKLKMPEYNSDVIFVSPLNTALWELPRIVPHPPPLPSIRTISSDAEARQLIKRWKVWIRQHRAELEKMRPVGQRGLSFSGAGCPVIKPSRYPESIFNERTFGTIEIGKRTGP
jgi:hypothetical protein